MIQTFLHFTHLLTKRDFWGQYISHKLDSRYPYMYFYLLEFLRSDLINIDSASLKVYLQYRIPVEMYLNMGENFDFPLDKEILDFIKELKNKTIENYKMTDDKDNFYEFLINKLGLVKKYSSNFKNV